jgi:hypothetical protein
MKKTWIMMAIALVAVAILAAPAMAHGYTCGPHDSGTCPIGQACVVTGQDLGTCHECGGSSHCDHGSCHVGQAGYQSCNPSGGCNVGYQTVQNNYACVETPPFDCEQGEYANLGQCVSACVAQGGNGNDCELTCKACGLCEVDADCSSDEACVEGACTPLQCEEGEHVSDHACVADVCGVDFVCDEGYHCDDNVCVADVCGVDFQCDDGFHCEGNACVENPPLACGVDFFCEEGFHCFENECAPDACGVDYCTEQGYHCEGSECVENPPPTCDPACGDNSSCEGTTCVCDDGYHEADGQCVENPQCGVDADCPEGQGCVDGACVAPTVYSAPDGGADDSHRDGAGFVLWDRLITLADRDEGYYWHTFNQTEAWVRVDGPGAFNVSFVQVQPEYARSAHGEGSYPADALGEWTIVLLGTNSIDNPNEPRVLAACHIHVEPLALTGLGVQHAIVERTRNYVEG